MDSLIANKTKGTILVTGANGSLGSTIVSQIVSEPELAAHHGLYAVRNANAAPALAAAIGAGKRTQNHTYDLISLDLTDLASIRVVAALINARVAAGEIPALRSVILNAGYLEFTSQSWTKDGFDTSFASNYLGHWLLTLLLLQSLDRQDGRIIVVGSESHDPFNSKSKAAFNEPRWMTFMPEDNCDHIAYGTWSTAEADPSFHCGFRRYGASKFCQVMMIPELQHRLDSDPVLSKIRVLGVDPGSMPTNLIRRGPWMVRVFMFQLIMPWLAPLIGWLQPNGPFRTLRMGATDVLAAALDSGAGRFSKATYFYGSRIEEMTTEARDEKKRERLWVDSVRYTGLTKNETALMAWA
ncbi:hypothetical protein N0V93_000280 [Gnomoniopsis smithogilvyi]|uniref:Short-chain dehydrogenase n=1 Tax=Gnomoniopsis smithogilvyi TaxID=1191159 RepID=A0A9W9D0K8_9PEZI|nr:hypothetical protein N0V93_000280 [Gnomoniopsis smithogilvyi]